MITFCCGLCHPLRIVEPMPDSTLPQVAFDKMKAGDYYCEICTSDVSPTGFKYFWKEDVPLFEIAGEYYPNPGQKEEG